MAHPGLCNARGDAVRCMVERGGGVAELWENPSPPSLIRPGVWFAHRGRYSPAWSRVI